MSQELTTKSQQDAAIVEKVLVQGDLSSLTPEQRVIYYNKVCESLGLNPLTKPFEYITLNGKLTLYARRDCTDQVRKINQISVEITSREKVGDVYIVTARAKTPEGRVDESTGCVVVGHLKGEPLANAFMKCETKAKRRVTLSICGLGLLDETEVPEKETSFNPAPKPIVISEPKAVESQAESEKKRTLFLGLLNEEFKKKNWSIDQIKSHIKKEYEVESSKQMSLDQIQDALHWLQVASEAVKDDPSEPWQQDLSKFPDERFVK